MLIKKPKNCHLFLKLKTIVNQIILDDKKIAQNIFY